MIRLLICDDEEIYVKLLKEHVETYMNELHIECNITAVCDPVMIMNDGIKYDIAMLDIQMGNITGTELAAELRNRNSKAVLFFITNYNEYQDEAMDLRALRFFTKPFDLGRLRAGIDKALEYISEVYADVFVGNGNECRRVPIDDIIYIMNENRRIVIVTAFERFVTKVSVDEWKNMLPSRNFFKYINLF